MLYYYNYIFFIVYSLNSNGARNTKVMGSILRECMKQ